MTSQELGTDLHNAVKILIGNLIDPLNSKILLDKLFEVSRKQKFNLAQAVIQLASTLDKIEELIRVCIDNLLDGLIDPGLIFRGENINTKILVELCKITCGTFIQALIKDEMFKLVSKKKSDSKIRGHAQIILHKILTELNYFPEGFTRLCSVVDRRIYARHPSVNLVGMSNLVFLRFIFPILIEMNGSVVAKYPQNITAMVKMLKNVVTESTRVEIKDKSKFVATNVDATKFFLTRLGAGRISDIPLRQIGYFIIDIDIWMQLILDVGLDIFNLDEWIFVYNTFFRLMQLEKIDSNGYIRVLEYFRFTNSKEVIRSRSHIETFEDYLSSSPETRKRILIRGLSEPIPTLSTIDLVRSVTPGCSSDR